LISAYGFSDDVTGLRLFCELIWESAGEALALVKPQSAYFERFGADGIAVLQQTIAAFQRNGTLVLLDVKRGDIGSTLEAYGAACLGAESALGADAMTAQAYFGFESLAPLFTRAAQTGGAVFVVLASSNPEGARLQGARLDDGRSIAESLADDLRILNMREPKRPGAAVVGATRADLDEDFFARLNGALILAPGIGVQGARLEALPAGLTSVRAQLIPTTARSVLAAGPDRTAIQAAILRHCQAAQRLRAG
jgi:orotidine-5'-phosphate decarboxylase